MSVSATDPSPGFFFQHEFAIRRIHSLLGIVPLGIYMCVHLTTNASLLNGAHTFQRSVFFIHSPEKLLPLIEWVAILLPLIFHAVIGVWISKTARFNSQHYKFVNNRRFVWQRVTGIIALVFLFFHVLHLHGWVHAHVWLDAIRPVGFAQFYPYHAASSLVAAMQGIVWPAFYLVGVMACVYHLANGLWTAGITWGLWISPKAQARATKVCVAFGVVLAVIGTAAWWAAVAPSAEEAQQARVIEDEMYESNLKAGLVYDRPEKRLDPEKPLVPVKPAAEKPTALLAD